MSIEGIALEHFSALPQTEINSVFHSFLSDDSKQDAAITNSRSNCLIELVFF